MKKNDDIEKLMSESNKHKVQCKCGTKTVMPFQDKAICRGCGCWVYKDKKLEFKEKLKLCMKN